MAVNPQSPLDMNDWMEEPASPEDTNKNAYWLELIPLILIGSSVGMRYLEMNYWREVLIAGGAIAALVYLFFSWYILQVKKIQSLEFLFSLLTGLVFPVGIACIYLQWKAWAPAETLLQFTLGATALLLGASFLLLFFNASDIRKGTFYRNLIGRLLILIVILIRIYI